MDGDEAEGQSNAFVRVFLWIARQLWEVWLEPFLIWLGVYLPKDPTYGRWDIPFSKMEQRLHDNPDVTCTFHKVMMPNGYDWVWYQVWEDKLAQRATGREADMVFVHGTGVHSGTLASHSRRYLDAGFRLIVPDLPSHGYSTGMHVYQRKMKGYTDGVRQVIHDVARRDDERLGQRTLKENRRTTFLLGLSFGGLAAILYPMYYPGSLRSDTSDPNEIPIDGVVAVGPIVGWSETDIKVGPLVRAVSHTVNFLKATRIELYVPHKKVVDKDPKVYKQLIDSDKRSHRGAFRVGHLFCIRDGTVDTVNLAKNFRTPIYIQHGLQDRVVLPAQSVNFLRLIKSDDVKMTVYPVCQHVIYRKAKTETEDLAGRVAVLEDNVAWMCDRSPGHGHIDRGVSFSSDISESLDSRPPNMHRMPSFSVSSGPATPGETVFQQESLSARSTSSQDLTDKQETGSVVSDTIQSLTSQIDTALDSAATASAVPRASNELTNRGRSAVSKSSIAPPKSETRKKLDDMTEDQRIYRKDWTLAENLRPYDLVI
ncbi:hypothetical protein MPSI1_002418 [Malassezia psittaci]|uniref:Serine aminopeptidase S33 domain-containing protein n=1 Tax=Malassezia psittaci TaxID=1821823 RepID=A0AAF0JEU3_9BASI|nr:hypothetical protein MPSI1_002418 [Malassezia psittaci]